MNPQPTFDQHLTAWKWAVAGQKKAQWPVEIVAPSLSEFEQWQKQLLQTKIDANKAGNTCQFNKGGSKSGRAAAWIVAGVHTFKIAFQAKPTRPQAVTQTSREAYHSLDFTTQRGQIASIIFEATMKGKGITRKEIEVFNGLGCNVVAGRVKELLEMSEKSPFVFGAHQYRLKVTGTRLSKCDGASNVPNEELVWMLEAGEQVVCSRMGQGQSSLFQ